MDLTLGNKSALVFSILYLALGSIYFVQRANIEFVIYIVVILALLGLMFGTLRITKLPTSIVWLICIWGLMHVLGGAVHMPDGVLFAYRIYPFLDKGGDFYILKYDQVVHAYLYGTMTLASYAILTRSLMAKGSLWLLIPIAMMSSMGISAMNEIMEFLISLALPSNGVGGYENTLLDLCSNFTGSTVAAIAIALRKRRRSS